MFLFSLVFINFYLLSVNIIYCNQNIEVVNSTGNCEYCLEKETFNRDYSSWTLFATFAVCKEEALE